MQPVYIGSIVPQYVGSSTQVIDQIFELEQQPNGVQRKSYAGENRHLVG